MTHRSLARLVVLAFAAIMLTAGGLIAADVKPAPTTIPIKKPSYQDRYAVLSGDNLFLKERPREPGRGGGGPNGSGSNGGGPRYNPPPLEASFVLRGVVLEEGQYRAYVEDIPHGKVLRLSVGDPVARGHVAEIEIDAISYIANEGQAWVDVGRDLRGQVAASVLDTLAATARPTTGPSTGGSTTAPAGGGGGDAAAAIDPNNPNLSMEEKMRLRRLQGK